MSCCFIARLHTGNLAHFVCWGKECPLGVGVVEREEHGSIEDISCGNQRGQVVGHEDAHDGLARILGRGGDSSLDGGFDLAWAQPAGREGQAGLSAVTIETRLTLLHAASRMRV